MPGASFQIRRKNETVLFCVVRFKMGLPQQSRNIKVVLLAVLVAVVALCFVAWSQSMFGKAPNDLRSELKKASADGMPVEPADLRRQLSVPDDKNAGPYLSAAFRKLKAWQSTQEGKEFAKSEKILKDSYDLNASQRDNLKTELNSAADVLAQLSLAVRFPLLDFKREWEKGPSLLLPEYADGKSACRLFLARARIQLTEGNSSGASDSMESAARLTNLMGQEPVFISLLVRCAMEALVLREVGYAIDAHSNDRLFLERCKSIVLDLGTAPDIRRAVGAEMVSGLIASKLLEHQTSEQALSAFGDSSSKVIAVARFGPALSVMKLRYVQIIHKLYEDLSQNPKSYLAMRKAFEDVDNTLSRNDNWSFGLAELLCPSFGGMSSALGEGKARQNVTLCAIDLLENKLRTGSFPKSLSESSGQWQDPFTEKALLYRRSPTGFIIYSVGPDGKDNGGKPRAKDFSNTEYDIPFTFPHASDKEAGR